MTVFKVGDVYERDGHSRELVDIRYMHPDIRKFESLDEITTAEIEASKYVVYFHWARPGEKPRPAITDRVWCNWVKLARLIYREPSSK